MEELYTTNTLEQQIEKLNQSPAVTNNITTVGDNVTKFMLIISLVISLIMWIVIAIGRSKCIKKAGDKAWKAFIPFYGTYVLYKISGMKGYWIIVNVISELIGFIGIGISLSMLAEMNNIIETINSSSKALKEVNKIAADYAIISGIVDILDFLASAGLLALNIVWAIKFCKSFGKGGGYIAGMILVPFVFYLIIGLGDAEYVGNYKKANNDEMSAQ